jgi:hypothetical protein
MMAQGSVVANHTKQQKCGFRIFFRRRLFGSRAVNTPTRLPNRLKTNVVAQRVRDLSGFLFYVNSSKL